MRADLRPACRTPPRPLSSPSAPAAAATAPGAAAPSPSLCRRWAASGWGSAAGTSQAWPRRAPPRPGTRCGRSCCCWAARRARRCLAGCRPPGGRTAPPPRWRPPAACSAARPTGRARWRSAPTRGARSRPGPASPASTWSGRRTRCWRGAPRPPARCSQRCSPSPKALSEAPRPRWRSVPAAWSGRSFGGKARRLQPGPRGPGDPPSRCYRGPRHWLSPGGCPGRHLHPPVSGPGGCGPAGPGRQLPPPTGSLVSPCPGQTPQSWRERVLVGRPAAPLWREIKRREDAAWTDKRRAFLFLFWLMESLMPTTWKICHLLTIRKHNRDCGASWKAEIRLH